MYGVCLFAAGVFASRSIRNLSSRKVRLAGTGNALFDEINWTLANTAPYSSTGWAKSATALMRTSVTAPVD
jgi:hypothetical protein